MTAEIVWEGSTLCRTLWWGMVFAAEYDTIRIFRRIVKHNMLVIMVLEDMAYWIYVLSGESGNKVQRKTEEGHGYVRSVCSKHEQQLPLWM